MKARYGTFISLLAGIAVWMPDAPAWAAHDRLVYEIVESAAGTRSQGWRGTLYDKDGLAVSIQPGLHLKTTAGTFVALDCIMPWRPCGAIPVALLRGPSLDHAENVVMTERWSYRIYAVGSASKTESLRGELIRDEEIVKPEPENREMRTPMGTFVWQETSAGGLRGWLAQTHASHE